MSSTYLDGHYLVEIIDTLTGEQSFSFERTSNGNDENDFGSYRKMAFPEMSIESYRLRSFIYWPKQILQRPENLSDAGFFYSQKGDRVICFSCGNGLQNWYAGDDPWEQHAVFFKDCFYLKLMKGEKFITETRKRFSLETPPDDRNKSDDNKEDDKRKEETPAPNIADTRLCQICCIEEFCIVFLPCGHVATCAKCAVAFQKCPMCQGAIEDIKRVYFP